MSELVRNRAISLELVTPDVIQPYLTEVDPASKRHCELIITSNILTLEYFFLLKRTCLGFNLFRDKVSHKNKHLCNFSFQKTFGF